jgi:hypothetical protein
MDVVSGIASVSQVLAYSHSTTQVLIKLYKQVRGDPVILHEQQANVRILLSVVDSVRQRPAPQHILQILVEVAQLAHDALNLITQIQRRGFFGLRWGVVHRSSDLSEAFAALKEKRDILHLAITVETHQDQEGANKDIRLMSSDSEPHRGRLSEIFRRSRSTGTESKSSSRRRDFLKNIRKSSQWSRTPDIKWRGKGNNNNISVGNGYEKQPVFEGGHDGDFNNESFVNRIVPDFFGNTKARDARLSRTASETYRRDSHDTSSNLSARGAYPYTARNDAYNPHSPSPSVAYSTPQLTRQAMDARRLLGFEGNGQEIQEGNEEQRSDYSSLEQEWRRQNEGQRNYYSRHEQESGRQSEQLHPVHASLRDSSGDRWE